MALAPKQARFVEEYPIDLNATQAAIRAGYSPRTAQEQGARLLSNVMVQAAIQSALAARTARVEITQDYVITALREIAERCMQRVAVLDSDGNPTGKWTFQARAATGALQLLGKHLGMFSDRLQVEHAGAVKVYVAGLASGLGGTGDFNPDEA